jgi:hypothetical protein
VSPGADCALMKSISRVLKIKQSQIRFTKSHVQCENIICMGSVVCQEKSNGDEEKKFGAQL